MEASSTAGPLDIPLEMPAWKNVASHLAAFIVAVLFVSAGVWKIADPFGVARLFEDLRVPFQFSLPLVLTLAVAETFCGALVLVPRFRRWGAWLAAALLVAFMIYIGANYQALIGKECSCFPWVKRTVGPGFFVGDALMLAAALLAAWWSQPPWGKRSAAVVLGAVAVFTAVSYGSAMTHQSGTRAPEAITVDGKPFSLQHGRIFIFFYDPQCMHCDQAARQMAAFHWKEDVTVIGVPTNEARWAQSFLHDTGLKALTSLDLDILKKTFPFGDPPYGVYIENGRERAPIPHYDKPEPGATLRKLGLVQ